MTKHNPAHSANQIIFEPFVLELGGSFHPKALDVIRSLSKSAGNRMPAHATWTQTSFYTYWRHRISCTSQFYTALRMTSAARTARQQTIQHFDEDAPPADPSDSTVYLTENIFNNLDSHS